MDALKKKDILLFDFVVPTFIAALKQNIYSCLQICVTQNSL